MLRRVTAIAVVLTTCVFSAAVASGQAAAGQSPPAADQAAQERGAQDVNLATYAELLRSDVRTQKVAIITEVMGFTEAEDAAFWPIYREYDVEMSKLGDERVNLIQEYARNYSKMTDAVADSLATGALALEGRRNAVKTKYYERFKQALSPRTAARFLQVEQQLLLLIDLQILSSLPIMEPSTR
jgi:CHAT domain-containing protein